MMLARLTARATDAALTALLQSLRRIADDNNAIENNPKIAGPDSLMTNSPNPAMPNGTYQIHFRGVRMISAAIQNKTSPKSSTSASPHALRAIASSGGDTQKK